VTLGRTRSVAVAGIHGCLVDVEADAAPGVPKFILSGMPDAACRQAPDRIRAAAGNCELELPRQRVTVNLSPASLPKQGSGFDVAIAVAVMVCRGTIKPQLVADVVHLGELGLDGTVRAIPGVLPAVLAAQGAGIRQVVVPAANAAEAALVPDIEVVPVDSLGALVQRYKCLAKGRPLPEPPPTPAPAEAVTRVPDLADVVGQSEARYALEVAAAGGHHLAMIGPPGAGKTMIAERLPGLLPPLTREQALEVTAIHSVLGALPEQVLIDQPPFVAPHHGASMPAVVGGGSGRVRPGAVSRAHRGVMFLDECPEFRRDVLDALRQPLESGVVRVARADQVVTFPARFQLVLAANPCPCGQNYGKGSKCTCAPQRRRDYLSRMSGPLLDRVDVQLTMLPVTRASLAGPRGEASAQVAARVLDARRRQAKRWSPIGYSRNSEVPGAVLRSSAWRLPCHVTRGLDRAMELGQLTLRGYDRCLRVAWTISDLDGAGQPGFRQVEEARGLRAGSAAA